MKNSTFQKVLFPLLVIDCLAIVLNSSAAPLIPLLANQKNFSIIDIGYVTSGFGIARLLTGLFFGMLADKKKPIFILVFSLFLLMIGCFGVALSKNLVIFALSRLLQGCAVGGISITVQTLYAQIARKHNNAGNVFGQAVSYQNAGMILGPIIGGQLSALTSIDDFFLIFAFFQFCFILYFGFQKKSYDYSCTTLNRVADKITTKKSIFFLLLSIHLICFFLIGAWNILLPLYAKKIMGWSETRITLLYAVFPLIGLFSLPLLKQKLEKNWSWLFFLGFLSFALQGIILVIDIGYIPYLLISAVAGFFTSVYFTVFKISSIFLFDVNKYGTTNAMINGLSWGSFSAGSAAIAFLVGFKNKGQLSSFEMGMLSRPELIFMIFFCLIGLILSFVFTKKMIKAQQ